jgi:hypothetical protein
MRVSGDRSVDDASLAREWALADFLAQKFEALA